MPPLLIGKIPFRKLRVSREVFYIHWHCLRAPPWTAQKPLFQDHSNLARREEGPPSAIRSHPPYRLEAPLLAHRPGTCGTSWRRTMPHHRGMALCFFFPPQEIKGCFSNTHFVGDEVWLSEDSRLFQKPEFPRMCPFDTCSLVILQFLPLYPSLSVVISPRHFLFPENPLPSSCFPSLARVQAASGTLSLLAYSLQTT